MSSVRLLRLCALAAVLVGAATAVHAQETPTQYNYCALFPGAKTHLFLLDRSSVYAPEDAFRLKRGYLAWLKEVKPGDRVVIRPIVDYAANSSIPLMEPTCVPGCPPVDKLPWYDSCDTRQVKKDQVEFAAKVNKAFDRDTLLKAPVMTRETAITETIWDSVRQVKPDVLVIFSDFLEHHPTGDRRISFYGPFDRRAYMKAMRDAKWIPDLSKTAVYGYGLYKDLGPNPQKLSTGEWDNVYKFWVDYFSDAHAAQQSLKQEYLGAAVPDADAAPPAELRHP